MSLSQDFGHFDFLTINVSSIHFFDGLVDFFDLFKLDICSSSVEPSLALIHLHIAICNVAKITENLQYVFFRYVSSQPLNANFFWRR